MLQRSAEKLAFDTRSRLIRHIYRLPVAVLERRDRGDLVSRITTDVSHTRAILSSGLVEPATSLVAVIVSLVMMTLIDPLLLGLAALAVVVVIGALVLIGSRTRPAGLRLQNAVGDLAGVMSRALSAMRTIRSTVSTDREAGTAVRHARSAFASGLRVARLRAVIQTFTGVAVQLLLVAVVAAGALRVASGALTIGELSAFLMYLLLMAAPITMLGGVLSMLGEAFGALTRITCPPTRHRHRSSWPPERPARVTTPRATGTSSTTSSLLSRTTTRRLMPSLTNPRTASTTESTAVRVYSGLDSLMTLLELRVSLYDSSVPVIRRRAISVSP